FRAAETTEEKIECLKHMITVLPKHKGTDHLHGDLKRRLAKLTQQQEQQRKSGGGRSQLVDIEKQGAGQVVLLGAPNSGKSTLLNALTNAHSEVGDYPFTTHAAVPGMMPHEDVQIQLIDTPPVTADYCETWLPGLVRKSNLCLLVADLASDDLLEDIDTILSLFTQRKVPLVREVPADNDDPTLGHARTVVVANKRDADDANTRLEMLEELLGQRLDTLPLSAKTGQGMADFPARIYESLDVIRLYTKEPGEKADLVQPYALPRGSTVEDLALEVHREIAESLKHARVWGTGVFDGQTVGREHVLHEKDIVELHA
ncbi:MAG: TGS domain-containing protein, partial [Armatimonadetes bacterium]|nr:TGS domain-containing protein [Armatimonadota bacterium]